MELGLNTGLRRSAIAVAMELALCGAAQALAAPDTCTVPDSVMLPVEVVTGARAALARPLDMKTQRRCNP